MFFNMVILQIGWTFHFLVSYYRMSIMRDFENNCRTVMDIHSILIFVEIEAFVFIGFLIFILSNGIVFFSTPSLFIFSCELSHTLF